MPVDKKQNTKFVLTHPLYIHNIIIKCTAHLRYLSETIMPPKKSAPTPKQPPTKRRAVQRAEDADIVLSKCRELRDALRNKSEAADDSDEWNISSDEDEKGEMKDEGKRKGAKTQRISLAELKRATEEGGGKTIVEVAEMNSTQVVEGIENVAVMIARQVLTKQVSYLVEYQL